MKRTHPVPRTALKSQIALLQQVIAGLTIQLGGQASLSAAEMDRAAGDRVEFEMGPAGCSIVVQRQIVIANGVPH